MGALWDQFLIRPVWRKISIFDFIFQKSKLKRNYRGLFFNYLFVLLLHIHPFMCAAISRPFAMTNSFGILTIAKYQNIHSHESFLKCIFFGIRGTFPFSHLMIHGRKFRLKFDSCKGIFITNNSSGAIFEVEDMQKRS